MISLMESGVIKDDSLPWEDLGEGVKRKIMAYNEKLMLVKVAFEQGAIGALHQHPHLQMTYVAEGIFEVEIENKRNILKKGDIFFIAASNLWHGVVCLEQGVLIDVFNPMREDFLK